MGKLLKDRPKRVHVPRPGRNEEFDFTTETGARPDIQCNVPNHLSVERVIAALKRIKKAVHDTLKLDGDDCTMVGMKHTECSWGLCNDTPEMWPDAKDHLWPYEFLNTGRSAPLYHGAGTCPMDKRRYWNKQGKPNESVQGCFYSCRFFGRGPKPKREEYLKMIGERIAELERQGQERESEESEE